MTVSKIAFSLYVVCLAMFFTGCSTMNVSSTPPMRFKGIEDGDAFTVVLGENGSAPQVSDGTESEIGQCIITEIQKQKPAVRFLPSDKFRSIGLSDDTMDTPSLCSYMKDWFAPRDTTKEIEGTDADGGALQKEGTEKTLTPQALHLQTLTANLGVRYVICASKWKLEGGKTEASGGGGGFGIGYSGYKSIQLTAWIFDVKNWSEPAQSTINVRDESFYGVVGFASGMGGGILPIIWPAFYRDSKACKALGKEIAKLILERPITSEQAK
jgi:hypothetical protein